MRVEHLPLRAALEHLGDEGAAGRQHLAARNRSAISASAMMRRWSVALCPVVFGRHVGQHEVGLAAQQRAPAASGIVRVGEVALHERGAGHRVDRAAGPRRPPAPRRAGPPPGSSRRARRRGPARGRPRRISLKRSSSSISLKAARERQPCWLGRAHIGVVELALRASAARRWCARARCAARRSRPAADRQRSPCRASGHAGRRARPA